MDLVKNVSTGEFTPNSNVGFVVMSQTDTIAFGNTTDKSLSIVIPATHN
jgi:hypothetical protein